MDILSTQVENFRQYISSMRLSKKQCIVVRILIYVFFVEFLASMFFVYVWFFSIDTASLVSTAYAATSAPADNALSKETKQFISDLKNFNLNPEVSQQIKRQPLSAKGVLISLGGADSLEVFEYPDHDSASREVLLLAKKYRKPDPNPWQDVVHIYVKDKLIVFYMGQDPTILESLSSGSEFSLIRENTKPKEVSSL